MAVENWAVTRLTMKEAEAYLGVNRRTLYRYMEQGLLAAKQNPVSKRIFFEEDDLERLREKREELVPVKRKKPR